MEKPSWGQVVTDLVNTRIYLLSPRCWSRSLRTGPGILERMCSQPCWSPAAACTASPAAATGGDMGDCGAYLDCAADALSGKVKLDMGLPQQSPGVWSAQPIPEGVTVIPPCWLGPGARWSRAP